MIFYSKTRAFYGLHSCQFFTSQRPSLQKGERRCMVDVVVKTVSLKRNLRMMTSHAVVISGHFFIFTGLRFWNNAVSSYKGNFAKSLDPI